MYLTILFTLHHIRRILVGCLPNTPADADDDYRQQSHENKEEGPDADVHLTMNSPSRFINSPSQKNNLRRRI